MKFVCLSDMHLLSENPQARLDNLVETQFLKLEEMLRYASKENAVILQAGDWNDKPRSWMLLPRVIDLLKKYNVKIYCVRGQHDDYMYAEETRDRTNFGILEKIGLITPLGSTPITVDGVDLYGANFGQELPQIKRKRLTVGVIHASISDALLWPGHQVTLAKKYLKDHSEYDLILVGDIHRRFSESIKEPDGRHRTIVNTGPMIRKEATEYNFGAYLPNVFVWEPGADFEEFWMPFETALPAAKVLSRDHIIKQEEADSILDEFVDSIKSTSETVVGVSFMENLLSFSKENKIDQSVMNVIARFVDHNKKEGL